MSAFITVCEKITSNRYVSIGITTTSLLYSGIWFFSFIENANPSLLIISTCAGIAFALLSKSYLDGIQKIDTSRYRNSLLATLSLLSVVIPLGSKRNIIWRVFNGEGFYSTLRNGFGEEHSLGVGLGFSVGFTATTLAIQLMEGKKKL
jgi:hypothetical protein